MGVADHPLRPGGLIEEGLDQQRDDERYNGDVDAPDAAIKHQPAEHGRDDRDKGQAADEPGERGCRLSPRD